MHYLRYEVLDHVAEITLDHAPVNALNLPMLQEILAAFRRAKEDPGVRAVILSSALPRRFCAGLDLDILLAGESQAARSFLERLYVDLADLQHSLGKPSIAAVDGAARAGGMTLSISCNVIVAGESATFGYPEIDVGIIPAIHFIHLPTIIGRHRAFELLFSGRAFDAREAADLGLVSKVVANGEALQEARTLARLFAAKPRQVMQLGHNTFMRLNDRHYRQDIGNVLESFCSVVTTADAQEGLRAFVEKRLPNWS